MTAPAETETATATATATATTPETRPNAQKRARVRDAPAGACATRPTWAATFRPPELWSDRRPCLRDVSYYAWYGSWTGDKTLGRLLGRGYATCVAVPAHAVGYLALWVLERPSRAAAALLLLALVGLTPPGAAALHGLAAAAGWAAGLG